MRAELEGEFDLVLMDIQLPDMSGVEAMKRIRKVTHVFGAVSGPFS